MKMNRIDYFFGILRICPGKIVSDYRLIDIKNKTIVNTHAKSDTTIDTVQVNSGILVLYKELSVAFGKVRSPLTTLFIVYLVD